MKTKTEDEQLIKYALEYADRGWRVFPLHSVTDGRCSCGRTCGSEGKHPRIKDWRSEASTDHAKIKAWFKTWPDANIAIATGQESGIFVLDADGESGSDSLKTWAMKMGWKPDTLTTVTGRGRHFIYRHPGGAVKNRAGIAPGLDIRGDAGYIVAPPSRHVSGKRYEWEVRTGDPAEAPSSLINLVTTGVSVQEQDEVPISESDINESRIMVGTRNGTLTSMAGGMRADGMDYDAIKEQLTAINQTLCEEPLNDVEVDAIARSVSQYPAGSRSATAGIRRDENPLYWFAFDPKE